jgi:nickel-dependent lactate racemase
MNRAETWKSLFSEYTPIIMAPTALESVESSAVDIIKQAGLRAGIAAFLSDALVQPEPLTIVVNDSHRFSDSRSAIEAVCQICEAENLTPRFRLLVATGSHVFDEDEIRAHEAAVLADRAEFFEERSWHVATDESTLKDAAGVRVHHWIADGKYALAVGSMEPHYFAGATGAHKSLSVGVLDFEDLTANHKNALSSDAAPLRLEGNPIYDGLAGIVRRLQAEGRRFFAFNQILADGRVAYCAAGDPIDTLRESLPRLRRAFSASVAKPQDLLVSVVHPPLDRDFYQADKGIKNVEGAVRNGGVILLDAECAGGIGIDRFFKLLQRAATHDEAVGLVEAEGYVLGDHKAVRLRALTELRDVKLGAVAPGLSKEDAATAGVELFRSRESAAEWARGILGSDAAAAIVDDAGNLVLEVEE